MKSDEILKNYEKIKRKIDWSVSRKEKQALLGLPEFQIVERILKKYREKYKNTYTGEEFDPIRAYRRYIDYCDQVSTKERDVAPERSSWCKYCRKFKKSIENEYNKMH